jgi:hypothetical protein
VQSRICQALSPHDRQFATDRLSLKTRRVCLRFSNACSWCSDVREQIAMADAELKVLAHEDVRMQRLMTGTKVYL